MTYDKLNDKGTMTALKEITRRMQSDKGNQISLRCFGFDYLKVKMLKSTKTFEAGIYSISHMKRDTYLVTNKYRQDRWVSKKKFEVISGISA